jgi:hypothetical protein
MFQKGNTLSKGKGRPKGSKSRFSLKELEESLKRIEKKHRIKFWDFVVERAMESDRVLCVLINKMLPDNKENQEQEEWVQEMLEFNIPSNEDYSRFISEN